MDKQKRNKHIQIFVILLIIGAMTFWYFTMVPQYYYIDHAGYKGGAIVLSGYFSWLLLINMIKRLIIAKGKSNIHQVLIRLVESIISEDGNIDKNLLYVQGGD